MNLFEKELFNKVVLKDCAELSKQFNNTGILNFFIKKKKASSPKILVTQSQSADWLDYVCNGCLKSWIYLCKENSLIEMENDMLEEGSVVAEIVFFIDASQRKLLVEITNWTRGTRSQRLYGVESIEPLEIVLYNNLESMINVQIVDDCNFWGDSGD